MKRQREKGKKEQKKERKKERKEKWAETRWGSPMNLRMRHWIAICLSAACLTVQPDYAVECEASSQNLESRREESGTPGFGETMESDSEEETFAWHSDFYDTAEEIPAPAERYPGEDGTWYVLQSSEVLEKQFSGRTKKLAGEVVYEGVSRDDVIPERAPMAVTDEESKETVERELALVSAEYEKERWRGDFGFTVTFHAYGSDSYRFGEARIPHEAGEPPLEDCKEELLSAIQMTEDDCHLERCVWEGEAYTDESGVLCRDARVTGMIRVWDCRAVYEGEVNLPDYTRYQLAAVYGKEREERAAASPAEVSGSGELSEPVVGQEPEEALQDSTPFWIRLLKNSLAVTVSLFLLLAVIWGFWRLRIMGKREE